jgi:hypothetical protein
MKIAGAIIAEMIVTTGSAGLSADPNMSGRYGVTA